MPLTATVSVLPPQRDPVRQLARWAAESSPAGSRVLNVGAGANVSGVMRPLLRAGAYIVGVDPDPAIAQNPTLAERHQMPVEEYARDHAEEFDVVVSVFVLEHVEHPAEFAQACSRVLRPGGSWFAVTPNVRHYFGGTTWALSHLRVADQTLHWMKGRDFVHEHRFPTRYRFNSQAVVRRECEAAGFERVEFRCYDATERYQWYLPDSLAWLPRTYTDLVYRVGSAQLMGHLSFRAVKPPT